LCPIDLTAFIPASRIQAGDQLENGQSARPHSACRL